MHMKRTVAVLIAVIMSVTAVGAVVVAQSLSSGPDQSITISVQNPNGLGLENVSIEGFMQESPQQGHGFTPVFVGKSGTGGSFKIENVSRLISMAQNWTSYEHYHNSAFSPFVMVFLTYNDSEKIYTNMTSIDLTPTEIMNGESYHASSRMAFDATHMLVRDEYVAANVSATPYDITNPIPNPILAGSYYYWYETNSSQVESPNGGYLQIPLAVAEAYGSAEVETVETMTQTSQDTTGEIVNPFSSSSWQVTAGASNGQNSNSYYIGPISQTTPVTNGWNYAYIDGYVTVANFDLWYISPNSIMNMGDYQTLVGITDIATSGSNIVGGFGNSEPTYQGGVSAFYNYGPISNSNPINGENGWYYVSSITLYNQVSNYGQLAGIVLAIGALALAVASAGVSIPATAGIIVSALGITPSIISWGSSSSTDIEGSVEYSTNNGATPQAYAEYTDQPFTFGSNTVKVPVLSVYVCGQPTSGGGGGGCVIVGTNITLANRSIVSVQDLKPGMKTLSYDTATGLYINTTVSSIQETNVTSYIEVNHLIGISGLSDQPIYVMYLNGSTGWTVLGNLNYTMKAFDALNGTWMPIISIELIVQNESVYDVVTAKQYIINGHTTVINDYIANGMLLDKKITA